MKLSDFERMIIDGLLEAYRQGAFPMADPEIGRVAFYTALRRGVFPLQPADAFHVPRSLRRALNAGRFELRCDTAFDRVVQACAEPRREEPESWINSDIAAWMQLLHRAGHAHSVEAWRTDAATGERRLVGGIYGVTLGGAFFGESMFSRPLPRLPDGRRHPLDGTDASKVCLVRTVEHLRDRGYALFDTQFTNEHLERFGCVELPQDEYMSLLAEAVELPVTWGVFSESEQRPEPRTP